MSIPAIILWDKAYNRNKDATLPRAVVNAIRTHMDNHTLEGWVKAETLADYTGLKIRAVRAQIAANVKAGWLEVVESGNSSGKANTYRLTYPRGVVHDTVRPVKGVADDTVRVSSSAPKGVVENTPTSPRTSPRNFPRSSEEGTSEEKGVVHDTIPTEPSGSGGIYLPASTTSESKGVADDTVSNGVSGDTVSKAWPDPFADWHVPVPVASTQPADTGDPTDPFSSAFVDTNA
ncbi:hypothetical protein ACKUUI_05975 [Mycobacterium seoulense]|uniref:hypothetical protein n=1 Tax=Mycobacterium seoulense TaxID=386911 RepID=UPI003CF75183